MIFVHMGNPCPVNGAALADGATCSHCGTDGVEHSLQPGPEIFMWQVQDSPRGEEGHYPLLDCVRSITADWKLHTWDTDPAPLWVASNSESLQAVLADQYGCPAGRPDGFATAGTVDAPTIPVSDVDPLAVVPDEQGA
jgi:hypothetical protein